jgi:hypothetical protein
VNNGVETMNRRLVSRCKGFLEVENRHKDPNATLSRSKFSYHRTPILIANADTESRIEWIHRTARDYLHSEAVWKTILDSTERNAFDPERHWANGDLGILKSLNDTANAKWFHFCAASSGHCR